MDVVNFQKCSNETDEECVKVESNTEITDNTTDDDKVNIQGEKYVNLGLEILDKKERRKWEKIFKRLDQVDSNPNDGKISVEALTKIVDRLEDQRSCFHLGPQTDKSVKREEFAYELAALDVNKDGFISLDEIYALVSDKKRSAYLRSSSKHHRMVEYLKVVAFAKKIRKWPPPLFVPLCSIFQLAFFILYEVQISQERADYTTDECLIFDRDRRTEIWRYITYSLIHRDFEHVIANLVLQLMVGLPLEMVHGAPRISAIYIFGVLAGSLASSCFDPQVNLLGASGGVYSLIAAHLSTLLLNWNEDSVIIINRARMSKTPHAVDGKLFRVLQLLAVVTFALLDTAYAFYRRYSGEYSSVSYVAHLVGSLVGLLVGIIILKDRIEEPWEKIMKAFCWVCFSIIFVVLILWNMFA